jgi:hypothetical protein
MARKMIVKQEKTILLLLCLLLQPLSLHAESQSGVTAEPWYQFEVLVFRRINPGAGTTEGWKLDPGTPDKTNSVSLTRGPLMRDNKPIAYRALPAEEKSLTRVWHAMRSSRDFRPLYHIAWRQPVVHPDKATPIYFSLKAKRDSAFEEPLPRLEGTLKFGIQRYLHLETDILLRAEVDETDSDVGYGQRFRSYRMQEKRRMRSGKLHYLDHPVLGVLTIAKRYEMPAPEVVEPPTTEVAPTLPEATQKPANSN